MSPSLKHRPAALPGACAMLVTVGILLLTLCGYAGGLGRLPELASHFKVQYLAVSLACLILLLTCRHRRGALAAALAVTLNAAAVLPWYLGRGAPAPAGTARLRLLLSNVYTGNPDAGPLLRLIAAEKPDVLVLQEVNGRWMRDLAPLHPDYPHGLALPRPDNFGIAVLCRHPLQQARELELGRAGVPSILAQLQRGGRSLSLLATHPLPPVTGAMFRERNVQLEDVAARLRGLTTPAVLVGDLNLSMWSPFHGRLERSSGLRNARRGFGVLPTWPAEVPPLLIPLDHVLVSRDITVTQLRTGPHVGSDHRPVLAELAFP